LFEFLEAFFLNNKPFGQTYKCHKILMPKNINIKSFPKHQIKDHSKKKLNLINKNKLGFFWLLVLVTGVLAVGVELFKLLLSINDDEEGEEENLA